MEILELMEGYERAKAEYEPMLQQIAIREEIYNGTHRYRYGKKGEKNCQNVRNIVFELIESQIDTTVPLPVVEAMCEEMEDGAKMIEDSLKAQIGSLDIAKQNDVLERIVPMQGMGIFEVYWEDDSVGVRALHPSQFIPQPGVYEIQEMDYFYIRTAVTKRYIYERYGVDLSEGHGVEENPQEMTEEVVCWYRNDAGKISRAVFSGDEILEQAEDFYHRRVPVCRYCGCVMREDGCPICGDGKGELRDLIAEEAIITNKTGMKRVTVPYYEPDCYPFIIWENVPKNFCFGGQSDVDVIADQQEVIKRLYTKVEQKLLKGGSFVQVPANMQTRFPIDEEELRVIYSNPMDAPVSVHTIQPDISKDLTLIRDQIQAAQATLGLNDSFQGKADPSALSGTAKRLLIEQANGRLQSKQSNKHRAYRELYRMIFRFMLAFCDDPKPYACVEENGKRCYRHFDRKELIMSVGKGYCFNDDFVFSVDAAGGLPHDRGYLYEQAMKLYQIGGFGAIGSKEGLQRLWSCLEAVKFPLAAQVISEMKEGAKDDGKRDQGQCVTVN